MNDESNQSRISRNRLQYRLPLLFGFVTFFSFAFAFPRFVWSSFALLTGTIVALFAFMLFIYYPVARIATWICNWRNKN
jgi:fatty acid desaturase